jgi:hypothetical protein
LHRLAGGPGDVGEGNRRVIDWTSDRKSEPDMADERPSAEEGQKERARRLREQIEQLKKKDTAEDKTAEAARKSLKEQIDERAAGSTKPDK